MRSALGIVLIGSLLLLATGISAQAQAASPSPPVPIGSLEQEAIKIDRSLQEIVTLLRELLARQEVDLLFKRIDLGLRKMEPLNHELSDLQVRKSSDGGELNRLRTAMTALEALESRGADTEAPDDAVRKIQLDADIKSLRRRIAESEQRIAEIENALAQERQSLQQWEMEIDRRLGRQ